MCSHFSYLPHVHARSAGKNQTREFKNASPSVSFSFGSPRDQCRCRGGWFVWSPPCRCAYHGWIKPSFPRPIGDHYCPAIDKHAEHYNLNKCNLQTYLQNLNIFRDASYTIPEICPASSSLMEIACEPGKGFDIGGKQLPEHCRHGLSHARG